MFGWSLGRANRHAEEGDVTSRCRLNRPPDVAINVVAIGSDIRSAPPLLHKTSFAFTSAVWVLSRGRFLCQGLPFRMPLIRPKVSKATRKFQLKSLALLVDTIKPIRPFSNGIFFSFKEDRCSFVHWIGLHSADWLITWNVYKRK